MLWPQVVQTDQVWRLILLWGTADAQLKAPSTENLDLPNVLSFKPGVGQYIILHASPTDRLQLFQLWLSHFSELYLPSILFTHTVTYGMGGVYSSDFYLWLDCYTDLCGWLALNVQNGLAVEKTKESYFLVVRSVLNETPAHGQAQPHQVLLQKLRHFRRYHPDKTQIPGHMTRWFFFNFKGTKGNW